MKNCIGKSSQAEGRAHVRAKREERAGDNLGGFLCGQSARWKWDWRE